MSVFSKVGSILVEDKFPLTLYRSEVSGCKVVIVDHPSVMVEAHFNVATVLENDWGVAHSLEHLIFWGSKKYPYSNFLDRVALKAYGYTNAHTDADMTVYKLTTVGSDNFLKILPVYLDGIINPLLTESSFKTEVYHINGEGHDAGVVYSEVTARNEGVYMTLNGMLYGKESTFARNIGGDPKDVRDHCSLEEIKRYHAKYYKMENMVLTVVGNVPHEEVLRTVHEFEQENNCVKTGLLRALDNLVVEPFQQTVKRIDIVAKGEHGSVQVLWRGPDICSPDMWAMMEFMRYFTVGPESPLTKNYVDSTPSVCTSATFTMGQKKTSIFGFTFSCTSAEYLKPENDRAFRQDLLSLLRNHDLDLQRLRRRIQSDIDGIDKYLECNVIAHVASIVQSYQNYAPGVSSDHDDVSLFKNIKQSHIHSLKQDAGYWKDLVDKYFTEDYIILYSIPNEEAIEEEKIREDERVKEQVAKLSPEGLKKCGEDIKKHVEMNKKNEASVELLNQFCVDKIETMSGIPVERQIQPQGCHFVRAPKIFHKIDTQFVTVKVLFDGRHIPESFHPLMKLFTYVGCRCPALVDGKLVSSEDLSAKRKAEILNFYFYTTGNRFVVWLTTTRQNADKIPFWLDVYLNKLVIQKDVILKELNKFVTDAENYKRFDKNLLPLLKDLLYETPGSLSYYSSFIECQGFYKKLVESLANDKFADHLVNKLNALKELIPTIESNVHITGHPDAVEHISFDAYPSFQGNSIITDISPPDGGYSRAIGKSYCIARAETVTSRFSQMIHAPFDVKSDQIIHSFILNSYFSQSSGALSSAIRGQGQAYHVNLSVVRDLGITLNISNATDLIGAYNASKKVVTELMTSKQLDLEAFESAKKQLVKNMISWEANVYNAADHSYNQHMIGYAQDEDQHRARIKVIVAATPEIVLESVGRYYLDLFDDSKICRAMVVPESSKKAVQTAFPNVEFKSVKDLVKDVPFDFVVDVDEDVEKENAQSQGERAKRFSFEKNRVSEISNEILVAALSEH